MEYKCTKHHNPFENHKIGLWCFLFPKHYKYRRTYTEDGAIVDFPISVRDFLRDAREGDE